MSDAQISKPIPLAGQRTLTKKEQAQCVQATAGKLPVKKSSCTDQVFLGMFFDGTGNNRDVDLPEHKHSNVVRLFRVHKDNSRDLTIALPVSWQREYVPGVGTAFLVDSWPDNIWDELSQK